MKLKHNINCAEFLRQARTCRGEVTFETSDGDILNLKSLLAEYVFLTLATAGSPRGIVENGSIICAEQTDYGVLSAFLEEAV